MILLRFLIVTSYLYGLFLMGNRMSVLPRQEHPFEVLDHIWTPKEFNSLQEMWQNMGPFQTVKEDMTSNIIDIGEAVPILPNGKCPHQYLIPNYNIQKCVLPSRIDVAHHHFKSGGISARKEKFESLIGRLLAFNKILHFKDIDDYQNTSINSLFSSLKYLEASKRICPNRPLLDSIQLGIIVLIPGQEVATHYDVPWFFGASRYDLPQWLLVVMERSQLFKDKYLPQVQGVAYIHNHIPVGGSFYFWPDGIEHEMKSFDAISNTGIVLDGSVVSHGVYPFGNDEFIYLDPNRLYELRKIESESYQWGVFDVDINKLVSRIYDQNELRVSFVWRSRCFKDENERERWKSTPKMSIKDILDRLKNDLIKRRILSDPNINSLDLAILLINTYIKYPYSKTTYFRYNYCMLSDPFNFINMFCS